MKGWFKRQTCVRARILSEVEDLVGKRVEKGELVLRRPDRVLRRFHNSDPKKSKASRLDGDILTFFNPARKKVKVVVRDFSHAPKALALLRAAGGLDISGWRDHFDVAGFKKAAGDGKLSQWRFVLTPRKDKKTFVAKEFKRIQVRIVEGGAFFSELTQVPKSGDTGPVTERYEKIEVLDKLGDSAFKEALLETDTKVVEKVQPQGE
jgi:hypothetical protein